MRIKVVVFPVRGRNWCFTQSIDPSMHAAGAGAQSSGSISTFKQLCAKLFSSPSSEFAKRSNESKLEVTVDFVANKMNQAWSNLEKAPQGTLKSKIHGLGLKLLSRVKPSEVFFRSIHKEVAGMDVVYPSSLNPRLVRRRMRHLAFRGSVIHKKYFYGSAILLPLTSVFTILPLPNIPFFWVLFRAYSHWRASQGSKKLVDLMSEAESEGTSHNSSSAYALLPSEELQRFIKSKSGDEDDGLSDSSLAEICQVFHLNSASDVLKYRHSAF